MNPTDMMQGSTALMLAAPAAAPHAAKSVAAAKKAAEQFEGVFISQMLSQMFAGVPTDGPFGGGMGEKMFRSLMIDTYGQQIAKNGGIGLATSVTRELLQHQEARQ